MSSADIEMDDNDASLPSEVEKTFEEKAREEAEARRLRILQSSNERLGLVEGTLPKHKIDDNVADTSVISKDVDPNEINSSVDVTENSVVSKKSGSASSAQRMAAMRRMRFKKSAAASTTNEQENATSSTELSEPKIESEATTDQKNLTSVVESFEAIPLESEESKDVAEVVLSSSADKDIFSENHQNENPTTESTVEDESTSTNNKKYQGVAKMRRRMVKERQLKLQGDSKNDDEPEALQKAKQRALKSLQNKKLAALQSTFPIYMSLVTLLLLFLAGLDVGLHQNSLDYGTQREFVTVHSKLAPREVGFRLSGDFINFGGTAKRALGMSDTIETVASDVDTEDEFSTPKKPHREESEDDNLDPLFGVDLDKLTAGVGLYYICARFAVKCHRVNLAIFYYFPLNTLRSIISGLWQLIDSPPFFCLLAIVIRQVIGKTILGAKLPHLTEVPATPAGTSKDVVSMAKSFVVNFITSSFPTAVLLYDIWVHVRADLYVILCGFLVGVALVHSKPTKSVVDGHVDGSNDEL